MSSLTFNETFGKNVRKILSIAEEKKIDTVLLLYQPNMFYATGIREPTGFAILSNSCGNYVGTSILDYSRISKLSPREFELLAFTRRTDEKFEKVEIGPAKIIEGGMKEAILTILKECNAKNVGADIKFLGIEVAKFVEDISKSLGISLVNLSDDISKVRSIKDDWEIEYMIKAQRIAETALKKAIESLNDGIKEQEIAGIIKYEMLKNGAWGESFPAIVAFHEDTAYPHHTPEDRILGPSGPVLIDLGSVYKGYASDMTRTLWLGEGGSKFKKLLEIVLEAQQTSIDMIAPGVAAWEPDNAARKVLEKYELSKYFIHGLGHGVGVEVHERPYLGPGSKETLEPGNVVTSEPGIYIVGLYGIRIEDMVLVTKKGRKVLSSISRIIT